MSQPRRADAENSGPVPLDGDSPAGGAVLRGYVWSWRNAAKRRRGAGWTGGVRQGEEALAECEGEAERCEEKGAKEWVRHGEEALVECEGEAEGCEEGAKEWVLQGFCLLCWRSLGLLPCWDAVGGSGVGGVTPSNH